MIRVGIVGATGYTGLELDKIISKHPQAEIVFATSESHAGQTLADVFPTARPHPLVPSASAPMAQADVVFLCLPHGAAAPAAVEALEAGARVIDLSADFRLADPAEYTHWYKVNHPAPELLKEAVYGLVEFARDKLPGARLVANPGCYPTSILLPLQPLLKAGAFVPGLPIIADSKSGVSGAGRTPKQNTHYVEVEGNFSPYSIGRVHRHLPEMEQVMNWWAGNSPSLIFTPHLLPAPRGILSTIYVQLAEGWDEGAIRKLYDDAYDGEPFVRVLPPGQLATLAHVNITNRCAISLNLVDRTLIAVSTIDNLIKGASGQAVQNMNLMFGLDETAGLL